MSELLAPQRARLAWRSTFIASLLCTCCGWPLACLIALQIPGAGLGPALVPVALSAVVTAFLLWRRQRFTMCEASVSFFAINALACACIWVWNAQLAAQAPCWSPFQANKLSAVVAAVLTPTLGVGLISIGMHTGSALLQWLWLDGDDRSRAAVGEPWALLAYAACGVVLLLQAKRRYGLERELERTQQGATAIEQLALTLLAIRDFANTPLQTLASVTDLIRLKEPKLAEDLAPAARAIERLRELNRILSVQESRIQWRPGEESLDPRAVLERASPGVSDGIGRPAAAARLGRGSW